MRPSSDEGIRFRRMTDERGGVYYEEEPFTNSFPASRDVDPATEDHGSFHNAATAIGTKYVDFLFDSSNNIAHIMVKSSGGGKVTVVTIPAGDTIASADLSVALGYTQLVFPTRPANTVGIRISAKTTETVLIYIYDVLTTGLVQVIALF